MPPISCLKINKKIEKRKAVIFGINERDSIMFIRKQRDPRGATKSLGRILNTE